MKFKLTRRKIIGSLAIPVVLFLYSLYKYLSVYLWHNGVGAGAVYRWSYVAAAIVGGVLPIILTLALGIDTSKYIVPRLLITFGTMGFISVTEEFVDMTVMSYGGKLLLLIISVSFSAVYFYKGRYVKFSEWLVMFISNPVFYYLIYYSILMKCAADLNMPVSVLEAMLPYYEQILETVLVQ